MSTHELVEAEFLRQFTGIPQAEAAIEDLELGHAAEVVAVDQGIEDHFPQGRNGVLQLFDALNAFEADGFDQELVLKDLNDVLEHKNQVAVADFLETDVFIARAKAADLDEEVGVEFAGVLAEKHQGCPGQTVASEQAELLQHFFVGQIGEIRKAASFGGIFLESLNRSGIDVGQVRLGFDHGVPCLAKLLQEEVGEIVALEFLLGAAGTGVISATERNRDTGGLDADFDQLLARLLSQVDLRHQS